MLRPSAVGAAQTTPVAGDVGANVQQHVELAHLAPEAGARSLVFPELSLLGYEMGLAQEFAFRADDARLFPSRETAERCQTTLVVGAPVKLGEKLYIGALILAPDGSVQLYTKQHVGAFSDTARVDGEPPPAEATVFFAGHEDPEASFDGHRAAVAVCADAHRAEHAARASERGARTYLGARFRPCLHRGARGEERASRR